MYQLLDSVCRQEFMKLLKNIWMLRSLLPAKVKVKITIDDIRLRCILTIDKVLSFTKKMFFYKKLAFTQSHSHPVLRFIKIFPGL